MDNLKYTQKEITSAEIIIESLLTSMGFKSTNQIINSYSEKYKQLFKIVLKNKIFNK